MELHIHITTEGTVDQVLVIKSGGWASMDKAEVKAAQKNFFRPADKGGEHVSMWINYPIQFALNKAR